MNADIFEFLRNYSLDIADVAIGLVLGKIMNKRRRGRNDYKAMYQLHEEMYDCQPPKHLTRQELYRMLVERPAIVSEPFYAE